MPRCAIARTGLCALVALSCSRTPQPNLVVDGARAESSVLTEWVFFQAGDCPVVEGCVSGPGPRKLLRFDLAIANRGEADVVIGAPTGPAFWSTITSSGSISRSGSSTRAERSASELKTTARPRCWSLSGEAADCLITAPLGARLPRRIARPPSG